jgi:hypothetical protein
MMKLSLALVLSFLSFSAFSYVDSKNCPEEFSITYSGLTREALTPVIDNNQIAYIVWEAVENVKEVTGTFKLSTRTESALCVYVNKNAAAFLQTNDGVDELMVGFNEVPGYFRTKVSSFSRNHIEVANDRASKSLLAPIFSNNPDSTETLGEVVVATAQAVTIK